MIATSTKVDITGVNVEKFDDKYFAKQVEKKKKKGEGEFFEDVVYPAEIVGKRIRYRIDGSKIIKVIYIRSCLI